MDAEQSAGRDARRPIAATPKPVAAPSRDGGAGSIESADMALVIVTNGCAVGGCGAIEAGTRP